MKEIWTKITKLFTEETPKYKYNKYFYRKTMYMRNVQSNLFLITIFVIGSFIPDIYLMPVVLVLTIAWLIGWFFDAKFDKNFTNPLDDVHLSLVQRYKDMFDKERRTPGTKFSLDIAMSQGSPENKAESLKVYGMLWAIEDNIEKYSPDKTSRWIGYIQRYLIEQGLTTVNEERDFSRPLFHRAYNELGYIIPESIDVSLNIKKD